MANRALGTMVWPIELLGDVSKGMFCGWACGGGIERGKQMRSILSRVKQITSPDWMHETSAQGWCTGKTQRDGMGREAGGGIRMENTCKSMADSCQCMAKTTTIL